MFSDSSSSQPVPEAVDKDKQGFLGWLKKFFLKPNKKAETMLVADSKEIATNDLTEQNKFYQQLSSKLDQVTPPTKFPTVPKTPSIAPAPSIAPKPVEEMYHTKSVDSLKPTIPTPLPIPAPVSHSVDIKSKQIVPPIPVPKPPHHTTNSVISPVRIVPSPKKSFNFFHRFFKKNLSQVLAAEREKELAWHERTRIEKKFWQPSNAIKPNLIKNQEVLFFNWHENLLVLGLSLMMCCLAIGLLYVGLLIWQKERLDTSRTALENSKVIDKQIQIGEQAAKEIKVFTTKLNLVNDLLNNHIYWTNFLAFLESKTLEDVYYEKFSGDLSGEYTIPGVARNLQAITLQLEVMKTYNKVKSLTPDTGQSSADGKSLLFNLGMSIDPTIFIK